MIIDLIEMPAGSDLSTSNSGEIVHLTSVHPPFDTRIFSKECRTLAQSGYLVSLIAPHDKNETVDQVRLLGIKGNHRRLKRVLLGLAQTFKLLRKVNGDLYHFHDPELILIGLYLTIRGKLVIYDIHEDLPRSLFAKSRDYIPEKLKKPVSIILEIFENFAVKKFSALIAATPDIGKRFIGLNPHTIVLNNYPHIDELWQGSQNKWALRSQSVSYVGSMSGERGLLQMVEAMSQLPANLNARLNLAGNISVTDEGECAKLRGWHYTNNLGFLNREEVANLLSDTRAGLLLFQPDPNHTSAQPNKLFEYMSAGIPVIASNFSLWSQIIDKFHCGITVDPTNSQKIAKAIEYILTHPENAERMGKNGRNAVISQFNWHAEEKTLLTLYHNLLAKKHNAVG